MMTIKTVCYFGDFDPEYARNRVIIRGLQQNGISVSVCHTAQRGALAKIRDLKRQFSKIQEYDLVIVGYSNSRLMVPLAKLWSQKPVVWDAFYSLYDAWVWDRKLTSPRSFKALGYWLADWFNGVLADAILLDTLTHIEYFSKTFILNKQKFIRVLIGADDSVFHL